MGVKYDWPGERIRGWVHKAIEAGWASGGHLKYFIACQKQKEKTSMDDLAF